MISAKRRWIILTDIWHSSNIDRPGHMMTSSNGNIFRVTGHLCGEFTGHRWIPRTKPVTRSFDVFFDLSLNKRLSKQSWGWWFETPLCALWRHCNGRIYRYTVWYMDPNNILGVAISMEPFFLILRQLLFFFFFLGGGGGGAMYSPQVSY